MEQTVDRSMDVTMMAERLRDMLVTHERVTEKIKSIDEQVSHINRRILYNGLDLKSDILAIQYQRLSTLTGVRYMYNQYRLRAMKQVQNFTKQIISELSATDDQLQQTNSEREMDFPAAMDTSASVYTNIHRECYRIE